LRDQTTNVWVEIDDAHRTVVADVELRAKYTKQVTMLVYAVCEPPGQPSDAQPAALTAVTRTACTPAAPLPTRAEPLPPPATTATLPSGLALDSAVRQPTASRQRRQAHLIAAAGSPRPSDTGTASAYVSLNWPKAVADISLRASHIL
jgi:hypothetical protein